MINILWNKLRALHSEKTGIPLHIIDYIAVESILSLCVSGLSNKSIANHLDMDFDYVVDVIESFLKISGWEDDLDFNPNKEFHNAFMDVVQYSWLLTEYEVDIVAKSFIACYRFNYIKEEIKNYEYVS